jgi:quinol monooxygenase YgiN
MVKSARFWAVVAMLTLAASCTPSDKPGNAEQAPAEIEAASSAAATNLPPASVLIGHRVADYDAWKPAFDAHLPARKDAGCLGHYLKRGIDESDMVYMYCLSSDADDLRAFLDSADLSEAMKNAGVQGMPEITLMEPMSRDLVHERLLPGIIVMHQVEDYDSWRLAYDEFDDFRRESGIVGHAVSRKLDDPNHVIVYHQANDVEDLRAFVASAQLKETMQRAGVVGDPDIRFIQVVDFATY